VGTVEPGKYADLILLDNPLDDINNTGRFLAFCGQWVNKEKIDTMLSELAQKTKQTRIILNGRKDGSISELNGR
jgi:hypothetical protein